MKNKQGSERNGRDVHSGSHYAEKYVAGANKAAKQTKEASGRSADAHSSDFLSLVAWSPFIAAAIDFAVVWVPK